MAGGLAVLGCEPAPAAGGVSPAHSRRGIYVTHVERTAPDPAVVGDTPIRFTEVAAAAGVGADRFFASSTHSLGVNWIDVDADGWPDLFAVGGDPGYPPRLYRNLGDGRFEAAHHLIPELPAYEMSGSVFADYDNDGDPDIYVYTDNVEWSLHGDNVPDGPPNLLLRNLLVENGGRVPSRRPLFVEAAAAAGVDDLAATPYGPLAGHRSKAASWLDYDRDGCVDLYVSHLVINSAGAAATRDRLYRNGCDGSFTDATTAAGLYRGATAWRGAFLVLGAHLDADLWPDLYVVNVSGDNANRSSHVDQVFRNAEGSFTQVFRDWYWIGDDAQAGMGIDVADVDGNGTWDLYISDLKSGGTPLEDEPWGNVLYLGHPRGSYADNSAESAPAWQATTPGASTSSTPTTTATRTCSSPPWPARGSTCSSPTTATAPSGTSPARPACASPTGAAARSPTTTATATSTWRSSTRKGRCSSSATTPTCRARRYSSIWSARTATAARSGR